jgi:hypothetical protein
MANSVPPPKVSIEIPDDYVLPAAFLRDLKADHPPPPSPVHKALMKDLCIGLYSGDPGPLEFKIPAFVHGYLLYDAEEVARWMTETLLRAGYDARLSAATVDPEDRDMWPDRTLPVSKDQASFPYDVDEYEAAIRASAFTITVA